MENGLRKELKLSGMIAMAAGGMIAAWMVEIKYWFELSGPGAVFSPNYMCNFNFTFMFYLFRNDEYDAVCGRAKHLDYQRFLAGIPGLHPAG